MQSVCAHTVMYVYMYINVMYICHRNACIYVRTILTIFNLKKILAIKQWLSVAPFATSCMCCYHARKKKIPFHIYIFGISTIDVLLHSVKRLHFTSQSVRGALNSYACKRVYVPVCRDGVHTYAINSTHTTEK